MGGVFEELSGAKGIRAAGRSEQNIANFNAEVAEQEAKAAKLRSGFDQQRQAKAAERTKSALQAGVGAAGGLGSPVAVDLEFEQARELELENLLIGFEGEVASQRATNQAVLDRLQGQLARQRSKSAARVANIQFGTQLAAFGVGRFLSGLGPGSPIAGAKGAAGPAPKALF